MAGDTSLENTQLRHELKCILSYGQYMQLSETIPYVLARDPNGDEYNTYNVRSLYFDDMRASALLDKINGERERAKYRLRIYDRREDKIMLECKQKRGEFIEKKTLEISRDLCDQLCARDAEGLQSSNHSLLRDMFRQIAINQLHPVSIVDYDREAYVHPLHGIRITFDKRLRTGVSVIGLFDFDAPMINAFYEGCVIMEVKYSLFLPDYLQSLISQVDARRVAASKYVMCRLQNFHEIF